MFSLALKKMEKYVILYVAWELKILFLHICAISLKVMSKTQARGEQNINGISVSANQSILSILAFFLLVIETHLHAFKVHVFSFPEARCGRLTKIPATDIGEQVLLSSKGRFLVNSLRRKFSVLPFLFLSHSLASDESLNGYLAPRDRSLM